MDKYATLRGKLDRGAVQRPAVAKQDEVANGPIGDQLIEEIRPLVFTPAKIYAVGKPPKDAVAAIEIDPMHAVAARGEFGGEMLEKSRRHALQKQEVAAARRCLAAGRYGTPSPTGNLTMQSCPPEADQIREEDRREGLVSARSYSDRLAGDVYGFVQFK
jgi:hypothetical protein